jgi:hypothetical protein
LTWRDINENYDTSSDEDKPPPIGATMNLPSAKSQLNKSKPTEFLPKMPQTIGSEPISSRLIKKKTISSRSIKTRFQPTIPPPIESKSLPLIKQESTSSSSSSSSSTILRTPSISHKTSEEVTGSLAAVAPIIDLPEIMLNGIENIEDGGEEDGEDYDDEDDETEVDSFDEVACESIQSHAGYKPVERWADFYAEPPTSRSILNDRKREYYNRNPRLYKCYLSAERPQPQGSERDVDGDRFKEYMQGPVYPSDGEYSDISDPVSEPKLTLILPPKEESNKEEIKNGESKREEPEIQKEIGLGYFWVW